MSDNASIRDRYIQPDDDEDGDGFQGAYSEEEDALYTALILGGNRAENAFILHYPDGVMWEVIEYGFVNRSIGTAGSHIQIHTSDGVYFIIGDNLDDLRRLLRERKLAGIHAYNPELYPEAPAANAPIVHEITYMDKREWWEFERKRDEVRPPTDELYAE